MSLIDTWMRDMTSFGGLSVIGLIFLFLLALDKMTIALEFLLAVVLSQVIIFGIRFFYFRARPGRTRRKFKNLYERLDESSFPSIHAARAGIIAIVLAQGLPFLAKILLWITATLICFSRYYLKRHHATDLLVGGILGLIIGYIVIIVGGLI